MTIVAGVSVMHQNPDAVHLAAMLARSADTNLVLTTVVPAPWKGKGSQLDRDYRDHLASTARHTLDDLRPLVPADLACSVRVRQSSSVSEGLVRAVQEAESAMLVLGSSTTGLLGRVSLGSVTERLLHSSPVPVAVAPRGFIAGSDARVGRVSIAHAVGPDERGLVDTAASVAAEVSAATRLVSFAVRPPAPITSGVGIRAETEVVDEWTRAQQKETAALQERIDSLDPSPEQEPCATGRGTTWARALEAVSWIDGDVLVIASSRSARSRRVFLGGTASKIARSSPVPVIVVPRTR